MKFAISFFWSMSLMAAPIKVYYESEPLRAEIVRNIFTKEYMIPEDLIDVKQIADCSLLKTQGKLEVCLKNNGDLLLVSVDRSFVNESLKIFRAP